MTTDTQKKPTDYTGVIIGALVLPVYFAFDVFLGQEELGRSVAIILGTVMFAIKVRWDLRKRVWFWAIIVFVLLLHVPLLFVFRWPQGFHGWLPAIGTLPIGLADLLIILGAVQFVEKFMVKTPRAEDV
jgi:cell division protein FtsW (lipid II flippase)